MDKENIIDFGQWSIPTSWDDITLDMFSDIERYYSDNDKNFDIREVLHILTGKSDDEINLLPAEFLEHILDKLSFIQKKRKDDEPKNEIIIDGEKYFINTMEKMKTGEYVAFDMALKNDSHDYSTFLAILCRKQGELYDSKYEAEIFEERKKMFGGISVTKVFPLVSFFLTLWLVRESCSQLYSLAQESLDLTQQSINSLPKAGVFRRHYLNSQMKKLRKSLESSKNI